MMQHSQSTATQSFYTVPEKDSTQKDSIEAKAGSQFLLSSVEAEVAVSQVSGSSDLARENGSRTEADAIGNQGDYLSDHTRYHGVATPVVSLPPAVSRASRMATLHALQEWEGHVVEIRSDEFVARLVDLTAGLLHESEEAIIPLAEISERDVARMVVGSIFRWVIGYERSHEGTRRRVSQIVFRDLPRMTEADLREGEEWACKVSRSFNP